MTFTLKEGILFLIAALDIGLIFFVVLNNPRKLVNWIFSAVPLGTAMWAIGLAMLSLTSGSLFWGKVVFGSSFLIFPLLVVFSDVFPDKDKLEWWHFLIFIPGLVFLLISPSELILNPHSIHDYARIAAPFRAFYNLYILACLAWTTLNLLRKYRRAVAVARLQIYYLFFGFFVFVIFVLIANLFLPLLEEPELITLGPASSLIFVTFATYAIAKYRLMDIRDAIQRGVIAIGLVAAAPPLFFTTYQLLLQITPGNSRLLLPGESRLILFIAGVMTLLILILVGTPLIYIFLKSTERLFFRGTYIYPEVVTRLTGVFDKSRSAENLSVNLTETLITTFKTDKAVFLLRDSLGRRFLPAYMRGFINPDAFTFDSTDEIINYARRKKGVFLTEEIKGDTPAKKQILEKLRKYEIDLCIPVEIRGRLEGIVFLGGKLSGDPYTTRDINLFRIVSELAGIALENAKLYTSLKEGEGKNKER